jgi:hypothetical protein
VTRWDGLVAEDIADRVAAVIRRVSPNVKIAKITLSAPEHRQLYETMPGVRLPYTSIDWSSRTLMFQGVPIVVAGGGIHAERVQ